MQTEQLRTCSREHTGSQWEAEMSLSQFLALRPSLCPMDHSGHLGLLNRGPMVARAQDEAKVGKLLWKALHGN